MRRIASAITAVILAPLVQAQEWPSRGVVPIPRRTGPPPAALGPRLPGAGVPVTGALQPPASLPYGAVFDPSRSLLWLSNESQGANLHLYDVRQLPPPQVGTGFTNEGAHVSAPGIAVVDGPANGLDVVVRDTPGDPARRSNTLLVVDYNGDLNRFDDTLYEYDPDRDVGASGAAVIRNVWYLDSASASCPVSCRPNTNQDQPMVRVNQAQGVAARRTRPEDPPEAQEIFVTSNARQDADISMISVTPGNPGTWRRRQAILSPLGCAVDEIDWDPDHQSFWMSGVTVGLVIETRFSRSSFTFGVVQCFPTAWGQAWGLAAIGSASFPHWLAVIDGNTQSWFIVQSGEMGRPRITPQADGLLLEAGLAAGGEYYVLGAAMGTWLGLPLDRERRIDLDLDPVFLFTVVVGMADFTGQLDANGRRYVGLPSMRPGVRLEFQFVTLGGWDTDGRGVRRISRPLTWTSP